MALANLWGLSLVTVFLSFGLVELPRHLWHLANYERLLRFLEFQAPRLKDSLQDAEGAYNDLVSQTSAISNQVHFHDDMRSMVDKMLESVRSILLKVF